MEIVHGGKVYHLTEVCCCACGAKFRVLLVRENMFCSQPCLAMGPRPENVLIVDHLRTNWKKWAWSYNR